MTQEEIEADIDYHRDLLIDADFLLASQDPPQFDLYKDRLCATYSLCGAPVGYLTWSPSLEIDHIEVHPALRRRRIATDLYCFTREAGIPLAHSPARSKAGDLWARSLGEPLPALIDISDMMVSMSAWPLAALR